jgi:hypothetical protein
MQIQSIQLRQATNQMQINSIPALSNWSNPLARMEEIARHVHVQNGVADITEAAKAPLESLLRDRLPRMGGSHRQHGEVTLDHLSLDRNGNFNGQLTITFNAGRTFGTVTATSTNNQLSLSSEDAELQKSGKLEKLQSEWQPKLTEVLDFLRDRPEFHDIIVFIRRTER